MEDVFLSVGDDGVPGVVPSLSANHEIRVFGQEINNLAFAFVPPLETTNDGIHLKKLGCVLLGPLNEIREFSEEVLRVVGSGSSFRVMLHGENRVLGAADAFDRLVVEIDVSDFSVIGKGVIIGGKAMVLRGNGDLSGAKIFDRVVSSAVSEF